MRRSKSLSDDTVVAYLPVSYYLDTGQMTALKLLPEQSQRISYLDFLHDCIEMSLATRSHCAHNVLQCWKQSCTDVLAQFFINSYVVYISKTDDLLKIKRGSLTRFPCHIRLIAKTMLHVISSFPKKELLDRTVAMMDTCITARSTQNKIEAKPGV